MYKHRTHLTQLMFSFTFLFFICLPSSGYSQKQKPIDFPSPNFDVFELADGVYACIHRTGGKAICNIGIVDQGTHTLIFDTFLSPFVAEEMKALVKYLKLPPVKYVINSHFHNDHIRGNQVFDSNAKILSTTKTRRYTKPILIYSQCTDDEDHKGRR